MFDTFCEIAERINLSTLLNIRTENPKNTYDIIVCKTKKHDEVKRMLLERKEYHSKKITQKKRIKTKMKHEKVSKENSDFGNEYKSYNIKSILRKTEKKPCENLKENTISKNNKKNNQDKPAKRVRFDLSNLRPKTKLQFIPLPTNKDLMIANFKPIPIISKFLK